MMIRKHSVKSNNSFRPLKKILIIIRRSLGDVLITSPLINILYEHNPKTQIDILVNKDTYEMARALGHVKKILYFNYAWLDKSFFYGIQKEFLLLKKIIRKYDLAISLTANERSTIYAVMAGKISIAATDAVLNNSWWRKLFLSETYMFDPNCHIVLNTLAALKPLKIAVNKLYLSANYSNTARNRIKDLLAQYGISKFLIFHPSARYEYKIYPRILRNKLLLYLSNMKVPIVITGGSSAIDSQIADELPKFNNLYNFIGKTTLEEVIALTDTSIGYIGMDTFNMHIAAAFNKKIVAIFGPTLPQIWSPWSNTLQIHAYNNDNAVQRYGSITLLRAAKKCVSCGLAGCNDKNGHSKCLYEISPEIIFKEIKRKWPELSPPTYDYIEQVYETI